jgi:flagellar hook assembly protein FlgD
MTIIPFELEKTSNISLKVYDVSGRLVNELVTGEKPSGIYNIEWDGKNLLGMNVSSGMYIYSLQSGEHKIFDKLLYLK